MKIKIIKTLETVNYDIAINSKIKLHKFFGHLILKIARRTTGANDNYFIKLFILFSTGISILRTLIPMFTMKVEFVNSEYHHGYK